jgi:hypothetical protein
MPEECTPAFKRIPDSEFGDEKYVSMEMVQTYRDNDDHLKCRIENLEDQTDPEVKKTFRPPMVDMEMSKGIVLDEAVASWKFNDAISDGFTEEFLDLERIELPKTNAVIDTGLGQITKQPTFGASEINRNCEGPWTKYQANAYWNIGWDKDTPFHLTPEWIEDPTNDDIPDVRRAITWTADKTGKLENITLNLHGSPLAEDDLYLEFVATVNGAPTGQVLGRSKLDNKQIQAPGLQAFAFGDNGPLVVQGTVYGIILRSPFTSHNHHYGIGGWGKNCNADPCPYADAWTSYPPEIKDGVIQPRIWMKHGKNQDVPYVEGMFAPQDFAYIVYTKPLTPSYSTTTPDVVMLKPFKTNPVTRAVITPSQQTPAGTSIKYYISTDKKIWTELNASNSWEKTFTEDLPTVLFFKAVLETTISGNTPILESITIHVDTNPAVEGECRCLFYNPRTSMPLGCSIWDEIDAPVEMDPNTTCLIDIIKNTERIETFAMDGSTGTIQLSEIPAERLSYMIEYLSDQTYVEYSEDIDFTVDYDTGLVTFVDNPVEGNMKVKYYPIWMKDLSPDDFPLKMDLFEEVLDCDGIKTSFQLKAIPLDPVRKVVLTDTETNEQTELLEGKDFTIDYIKKLLITNVLYANKYTIDVKYTPELTVTGLALQYRITREETDKQVLIQPNYYQYRV